MDSPSLLAPNDRNEINDNDNVTIREKEPVLVQAFTANKTVERFNKRIICWNSRATEIQRDVIRAGPLVQYLG